MFKGTQIFQIRLDCGEIAPIVITGAKGATAAVPDSGRKPLSKS